MDKEQFLTAIGDKISGLPQSDIDTSLDYYSEMIDDYMEDGMTLEQAVEAMGTADEIASQILIDTPLPKLMKAKARSARVLRAWEMILLILGSPIWVSLLIAVIAIFLAIYILIWSAVIVLYAADFSFAAGSAAALAGSALLAFTGNFVQALLFLGAGLFCAGAAILLFFAFNKVTAGIVWLSKRLMFWVKSRFMRKGAVQ